MLGSKMAGAPGGGGEAQQDPAAAEPEGNVTPEEQEAYDRFVMNGMEVIYPKEGGVSPAVMAHLGGKFEDVAEVFAQAEPPLQPGPIDNLAVAAVAVVLMLEASAGQAGAEVSDDIVFHGGVELVEQLADVAEAAQVHNYSEEEQEGALYRAIDLYRVSSGRVDQESLKGEFGQVVEADRAGQLGSILPGIEQRMGGGNGAGA